MCISTYISSEFQKEGLKELKKSKGKFNPTKVFKMLNHKAEGTKDSKDKKCWSIITAETLTTNSCILWHDKDNETVVEKWKRIIIWNNLFILLLYLCFFLFYYILVFIEVCNKYLFGNVYVLSMGRIEMLLIHFSFLRSYLLWWKNKLYQRRCYLHDLFYWFSNY